VCGLDDEDGFRVFQYLDLYRNRTQYVIDASFALILSCLGKAVQSFELD